MNLFDYYLSEVNEKFEGWDFSHIKERRVSNPLSWNYLNLIAENILSAKVALDMGTGGGEFLYSIKSLLPKEMHATEGYPPNGITAKNRLEPVGIKVSQISDDNELPYEDNKFDLIINRHESYQVKEIKRILKTDGFFITQQVGGDDDKEINEMLGAPSEFSEWNLTNASKEIEKEFKIIDAKEEKVKTRVYDIGAVIYFLKAVPWQIPDFSIDKYYNSLLNLNDYILKNGYLDTTCHRFYIKAIKKDR